MKNTIAALSSPVTSKNVVLFQNRENAETFDPLVTSLLEVWGCPDSCLIPPTNQQRLFFQALLASPFPQELSNSVFLFGVAFCGLDCKKRSQQCKMTTRQRHRRHPPMTLSFNSISQYSQTKHLSSLELHDQASLWTRLKSVNLFFNKPLVLMRCWPRSICASLA